MATFDTIKLDKGLYRTGLSFNAELEKQDPSENYKGTELEGLDAFSRQLKRFNIKVNGKDSSCVDKFFQTSDSAVLFPEYVSRAVKQGMEEANILSSLIATKTNINALDYRTIQSNEEPEDKELCDIAEGAYIPTTEIKTKENLVKLHKRGRMLEASYEAIRFQRLDLFTVALKGIGAHIAHSQIEDAMKTLVFGDGNDNEIKVIQSKTDDVSYENLVDLWNALDPYTLNTIITSPEVAGKIISLPEMKDSFAGLNFHATGKLVTPLGARLIKNKSVGNCIIGIDKNFALEMVTAGDIQTDYDRLIDRQLQRATVTQIAGFAKIFNDAAVAMTV